MTNRIHRAGPLIGSHVPVSGGLVRTSVPHALSVGAEAIQVFVSNPRGWAPPTADPVGDTAFRASSAAAGLAVVIHAPYLINLGSPDEATARRSRDSLDATLRRGAQIGAQAVVVHAGSKLIGRPDWPWERAMDQVREAISGLLRAHDGTGAPRLLIEPTAGGGGALASDLASTAAYLDAVGEPGLGVCIDTCHLHASGHDLSSPSLFAAALREFDRLIGADRLGAMHINDSRDPPGSKRDRHASLAEGTGTIGTEAFGALFAHGLRAGVPLMTESPDADHAADIAILKQLRAGRLDRRQVREP